MHLVGKKLITVQKSNDKHSHGNEALNIKTIWQAEFRFQSGHHLLESWIVQHQYREFVHTSISITLSTCCLHVCSAESPDHARMRRFIHDFSV